MATVTFTIDNALLPRLYAAYDVADGAELKTAIAQDIKSKVVNYEIYQATVVEQAKVEAAELAKRTAVIEAESLARAEVVLS